jgi:intein/homing endonuclease
MPWYDFYKLFAYNFEKGPLEKKRNNKQGITGAGVGVPDAIFDVRGEAWGGGSKGMLAVGGHDSNDFIDLSTVTNRQSRYKEYERLRNVAEIEMAMTVIADEACVAGDTPIATLWDGFRTIHWLTERWNNEHKPFLVYCWDFDKGDYTLGWAYDPRLVKRAKTVKVFLENGSSFVVTEDHRVLKDDGSWSFAGNLEEGNELKPFYRLPTNKKYNNLKIGQFPRIFTFTDGWKHERQFMDEWRTGKKEKKYERVNEACRLLAEGLSCRQVVKVMKSDWNSVNSWINKEGFNIHELHWLGKKQKQRRVIGVVPWNEIDVYDMSVKTHQNFCTDSVVMHNCQRDSFGHVFQIHTKNEKVHEELEFLCFNRKMLNLDRKSWGMVKKLCIFGDGFYELLINPENPKDGVLKIQELPPDSMYRIETTKCRLIEFQQGKEGPDYLALTRGEVTKATESELQQSTAIRFTPEQIIHIRLGDDRKTFYPYGQSLIEPARGPAHQLRLMEDAMVVYRLCLVGNSRIRTEFGWKHIKDITKGDRVFTYQKDGKVVSSSVLGHSDNGVQKTYKVTSKHVEIIGNDIHPILVNRDGEIKYVEIKNLIPKKDKIINVTRESEVAVKIPTIFGETWAKLDWSQRTAFMCDLRPNKSETMRKCGGSLNRTKQFLYRNGCALPYEQAVKICEAFDLDPQKLIITNKGQVYSERINVPEFVDEEFARLFGFIIGDGSVRQSQLLFSAGLDQQNNEFYASLLKKYFGKVSFDQDKRNRNSELGNYRVDSRVACKIFIEMGYIKGARNKRIPNWVYTASKNIRRAFIEGLSDADGCERYTKAGTWFSTIELCNQQLIEDIKEVWSSIGLCSGKLGYRKRKGGHEITPGRRMPKTESYLVTISDRVLPEYENVLSVEYVGDEDVYDLTVDNEEHNFIVNGIPTHNTRAPERRVFYIDIGQLPPAKAEAFIERMKDQFRKKKVGARGEGANAVEEKWHAPAADEDYWLPIRGQSNTRIDTLPGAQNLGEIDDALYFRNKLFAALNFPRNYFNNEDPNQTRITLSAQDVKFARMIERIQGHFIDGILELCERHLELRGYPEEAYEDLKIEMTPPSAWKELSEAEITNNRITAITSLKGSLIMSDRDLLIRYLHLSEEEAQQIESRNMIQKLQELKLQIISQNPQLAGVGVPGQPNGEQEIGAEAGGPNPTPGEEQTPEQTPPESPSETPEQGGQTKPTSSKGVPLPEPEEEDIKRFDLGIQTYNRDVDAEDIDFSEQ